MKKDSANDKIKVYALRITSGFIYHSKFGHHLPFGLKHVHHVLRDMNGDMKLRKDLSIQGQSQKSLATMGGSSRSMAMLPSDR